MGHGDYDQILSYFPGAAKVLDANVSGRTVAFDLKGRK
jgi:hypothetical protein